MFLAIVLVAAPALELELSLGDAIPLTSSECCGSSDASIYPSAPLLRGAATLGVASHLSAGLAVSAVLGGEGHDNPYDLAGVGPGFEAWSALPTLRAHARDLTASTEDQRLDLFLEAGAGVGQVISMQIGVGGEHRWLRGDPGLTFELGTGFDVFVTRSLKLGARLSWMIWTHVGQEAYEQGGGLRVPTQTGIVVTALALSGAIGFASPL